jgi:hypothetical protein
MVVTMATEKARAASGEPLDSSVADMELWGSYRGMNVTPKGCDDEVIGGRSMCRYFI